MTPAQDWFDHHRSRFERAQQASAQSALLEPIPELPAKYPDADAAMAQGLAAFQAQLGRRATPRFRTGATRHQRNAGCRNFALSQRPLGIVYPRSDMSTLFDTARIRHARLRRRPRCTRVSGC